LDLGRGIFGARRGRGSFLSREFLFHEKAEKSVAMVNPGEFLRQVRAESAKIVWPSRKETVMTGIMVVIMTSLLALFFFGVDWVFSAIVKALLGLLS
jgi:preprotein translocase subunit SecE